MRDGRRSADARRRAPNHRTRSRTPGAVEMADGLDPDMVRAVRTICLATAVTVPHAFPKNPRRGIATARTDMQAIGQRPARAR